MSAALTLGSLMAFLYLYFSPCFSLLFSTYLSLITAWAKYILYVFCCHFLFFLRVVSLPFVPWMDWLFSRAIAELSSQVFPSHFSSDSPVWWILLRKGHMGSKHLKSHTCGNVCTSSRILCWQCGWMLSSRSGTGSPQSVEASLCHLLWLPVLLLRVQCRAHGPSSDLPSISSVDLEALPVSLAF